MVEAAWVAVEHHPHWKTRFEQLSSRLGKRDQPLVRSHANCSGGLSGFRTTPGKRRSTGKLLRRYLDQLDLAEEVGQVPYSGRVYQVARQEGELT